MLFFPDSYRSTWDANFQTYGKVTIHINPRETKQSAGFTNMVCMEKNMKKHMELERKKLSNFGQNLDRDDTLLTSAV